MVIFILTVYPKRVDPAAERPLLSTRHLFASILLPITVLHIIL